MTESDLANTRLYSTIAQVLKVDGSMKTRSEKPFRILVFLGWLSLVGIRGYWRRQMKGVEKDSIGYTKRDMSPPMLPTYASLSALPYLVTPWMDFAHLAIPRWLRWLGVATGGVALPLFAWIHWTLGKNWSWVLKLSKEHVLVTDGPYRYVRHPMYSASFLTSISLLLTTANWFAWLPSFLALVWMYLGRVSAEEEMMVERFGDAYWRYMSKTGRLLPRCPAWHSIVRGAQDGASSSTDGQGSRR